MGCKYHGKSKDTLEPILESRGSEGSVITPTLGFILVLFHHIPLFTEFSV